MSDQNSLIDNSLAGHGLLRLSRLGFTSLADCLMTVPKEYRDCTKAVEFISRAEIGCSYYFILTVKSIQSFNSDKQPTKTWKDVSRVQIDAIDSANQRITITVFGAVWPWLKKHPGDKVHIYGNLSVWNGSHQINNPIFVEPDERGRVIAVYKGKVGQVSGEMVCDGVVKAMPMIDENACNLLSQLGMREADFIRETKLSSPIELLQSIHDPKSVKEGNAAVEIAKKLSALAIVRNAESNQSRKPLAKSTIVINKALVKELIGRLPYPLTTDQLLAINEIVDDLRAPYPMKRLLSGDVGTGKTLTFMIPAVAAYKAGATIGIVVPSQLLVAQIAREIQSFFPEIPVTEVISGGKIGEGIAVGTTALLGAAIKKKHTFNFLIVDEQHKFSLAQKEYLLNSHTNFLEATATVIPRTLAIVNYGGMDLSTLKMSPVQKVIQSRVVPVNELERLYQFVEKVVAANGQVAIIFPLVVDQDATKETKNAPLESVQSAFKQWSDRFPEKRICILTGKMDAQEKNAVIEKMNNQEIDLLISTVVIETGVTLPSLRALIVVHPERFGICQLHQLRGRVARKGGKGYFFMYCPNPVEEKVTERLDMLLKYTEGFDIAEADMNIRGFGDVDDESDNQTGVTKLLFWGVHLTRQDIEMAANGSKLAS